jgi:hypothetical protein
MALLQFSHWQASGSGTASLSAARSRHRVLNRQHMAADVFTGRDKILALTGDLIDGCFAAERVRVDVVQLEEPTFVTAMAIRPDVCTVPQVPHPHRALDRGRGAACPWFGPASMSLASRSFSRAKITGSRRAARATSVRL